MVDRFAGNNRIIQKMAMDLENTRRRDAAFVEELKERQKQQTRRDVAAVYGEIIPF